ncbi:MAG: hypothetical protein C0594_10940 [Marinilabiliales bacterium]|nr:MAG: hypothetical protein C0594_10940 [Marinilabiliales bacterium]
MDENPSEHYKYYWHAKTEKGGRIIKCSMGLSFLYMPFFLMAHGYAIIFDYNTNGFSSPYRFFLLMSSLFYYAIGLIYLRKFLKNYFKDKIIAFTLLSIALGTNIIFYTAVRSCMSHAYTFSLFALFLYFSYKWHKNPSIKSTIIIGLLAGLISLVRPTNLLIIIVFALWNVQSFTDFTHRIVWFVKKYPLIILMIISFLLVWIPQLLYWKTISGDWFFYSYQDEGFFFTSPAIIKGLFGFRNGWLLYTPIMIFALVGLFFLRKKLSIFRVPIIGFTILNIYIILSWWCWWYNGYGNRAFIESYSVLSIPLAAFYTRISQKRWLSVLIAGIVLILISLNIFQTYQRKKGIMSSDSMTK